MSGVLTSSLYQLQYNLPLYTVKTNFDNQWLKHYTTKMMKRLIKWTKVKCWAHYCERCKKVTNLVAHWRLFISGFVMLTGENRWLPLDGNLIHLWFETPETHLGKAWGVSHGEKPNEDNAPHTRTYLLAKALPNVLNPYPRARKLTKITRQKVKAFTKPHPCPMFPQDGSLGISVTSA